MHDTSKLLSRAATVPPQAQAVGGAHAQAPAAVQGAAALPHSQVKSLLLEQVDTKLDALQIEDGLV